MHNRHYKLFCLRYWIVLKAVISWIISKCDEVSYSLPRFNMLLCIRTRSGLCMEVTHDVWTQTWLVGQYLWPLATRSLRHNAGLYPTLTSRLLPTGKIWARINEDELRRVLYSRESGVWYSRVFKPEGKVWMQICAILVV